MLVSREQFQAHVEKQVQGLRDVADALSADGLIPAASTVAGGVQLLRMLFTHWQASIEPAPAAEPNKEGETP